MNKIQDFNFQLKFMCKHIIVLFLLCQSITYSHANAKSIYDSLPVKIGYLIPDFKLNNVKNYSKKNLYPGDFRGKWLIFDFWSSTCAVCIRTFPKIDSLQKKFKDKVQFVLIGYNGGDDGSKTPHDIENLYARLQKKYSLDMISAFDSILFKQWQINMIPFMIVVGPDGIVRSLPASADLDENSLNDLLTGKLSLASKNSYEEPKYNYQQFPGSPNNTLIYRSILTRGAGEHPGFMVPNEKPRRWDKDGLVFVMQPLSFLYLNAYFGAGHWRYLRDRLIYPEVILELDNDSLFRYDYSSDKYQGLYNYNLAVPASRLDDIDYILNIFRHELNNVFGYKVSIEKRKMPVQKIIVERSGLANKLRTKGHKKQRIGSYFDIKLVNYSISDLTDVIWSAHQKGYPIVDETNITDNIDIELKGAIMDLNDVKKSLRSCGLNLVLAEKEMTVLIIRN